MTEAFWRWLEPHILKYPGLVFLALVFGLVLLWAVWRGYTAWIVRTYYVQQLEEKLNKAIRDLDKFESDYARLARNLALLNAQVITLKSEVQEAQVEDTPDVSKPARRTRKKKVEPLSWLERLREGDPDE